MQTRHIVALTTVLATIGLGAALQLAGTDRTAPVPGSAMVADFAAGVDTVPLARTEALKVMPAFTVVPSREERLAARGPSDDPGMALDAAVDHATALARPVRAALPRARLGNPFYDFGRTRRATVAE